ncbi:MAG: hypothetical protein PHX14_08480 [Syntrophomonadaceae bacterium]|nr:hypothetical protein [Syntrophomonadaceae bacterium]
MDIIICGVLFIAVLAYLAYRGYRFFAKDEISTCFGEHYRLKDRREKEKRWQWEENRRQSPLE